MLFEVEERQAVIKGRIRTACQNKLDRLVETICGYEFSASFLRELAVIAGERLC